MANGPGVLSENISPLKGKGKRLTGAFKFQPVRKFTLRDKQITVEEVIGWQILPKGNRLQLLKTKEAATITSITDQRLFVCLC